VIAEVATGNAAAAVRSRVAGTWPSRSASTATNSAAVPVPLRIALTGSTPHTVADLEPADVPAALLDLAGEVDPDGEREPVAGDDLEVAGPRTDLATIKAGRADADEHLSRSRLRDRDLVELEDLRWPVPVVTGGEHVRSCRSTFGGSLERYDARKRR